ncbi:MAG: DUF6338 family protein [Gammaproteobacteria bacterium]|nr:DUF6338 family protein [Gammaproteobacteria bacterium]MDH5651107.1 DUF6338 family protein [Gammaproteobacteria bacterium]
MNITYETINILFLLIPGFISTRVLDAVITRKQGDNPGKVVEAFVFSFLIYACVNFIYQWQPLVKPKKIGNIYEYSFTSDFVLLGITLILSITIPLIIGAFIHNDLHTKILRKIHVTDKTSRSSVWQDVYVNEKRHIVAHLKDGRRVYGWPMYYSHNSEEPHLYLFQPAWVTDVGEYVECSTHGILLKNEDVEIIEFMTNSGEDLSQLNGEI